MDRKKLWLLGAPWAALLLGGCPLSPGGEVNEALNNDTEQAEVSMEGLQSMQHRNTIVHDKPWVCKDAILIHRADGLPADLDKVVYLNTLQTLPFSELKEFLHKLSGLPIRLSSDALAKLSGQLEYSAKNGADNKSQENRGRYSSGFEDRGESKNQTAKSQGSEPSLQVTWRGKISGLLDKIAAELGLSWIYEHGEVNFYYLSSRSFAIHAIPSETSMASSVISGMDAAIGSDSSGKSSGQGSGKSAQSTQVSLNTSMMKDIISNITTMLTPGVGRLSASPATGSVTVTDTKSALEAIGNYIETENQRITKQVLLNIKVLSLVFKDENQCGVNWDKVAQALPSVEGVIAQVGLNSLAMKPNLQGLDSNIQIIDGGCFKNSGLFLQALATQAKVSVVTSPSVTTLNLQPVPLQIAEQISYIARINKKTTTDSSTSGSSDEFTIDPATVSSGFNLNLIPFVLENNSLLLQYAINLSELERFEEVAVGSETQALKIKLPTLNNRMFSQKVKLRSGQTLVLSGFDSIKASQDRRGVFHRAFWFLGGGEQVKKERSMILLMITPIILD